MQNTISVSVPLTAQGGKTNCFDSLLKFRGFLFLRIFKLLPESLEMRIVSRSRGRRSERQFLSYFKMFTIVPVLLIFALKVQHGTAESPERSYPIVNKCCGLDQSFNLELNECEASRKPLNSTIWTVSKNFSLKEDVFPVRLKPGGAPPCSQKLEAVRVLNEVKEGEIIETSYLIDKNGRLLETTYKTHGNDEHEYQLNHLPKDYCVDPTEDALIFQICPPRCDATEPCIRKCCPLGERFDEEKKECIEAEESHNDGDLPLFPSPYSLQQKVEPRYTSGFTWLTEVCYETLVELPIPSDFHGRQQMLPFKVLTNGSLVFFSYPDKTWKNFAKPRDYCYERFRKRGNSCEFEDEVLLFCARSPEEEEPENIFERRDEHGVVLDIISKVTLVIAVLCLLATSCVHLLLMDRSDPQTWIRFLYIASEFVFLQLFVFMQSSWVDEKNSPELCKSLAIASHFFGLITLTWFSMYHFDSWWTFKEPRLVSVRKSDVIRFLEYCMVAVGVPLLIVSVALGVDSSRPDTVENLKCRSDIDNYFESMRSIYPTNENFHMHDNCFLAKHAHLAYWFDPILIILFLNLVFFVGITSRVGRQSNANERRHYSTIILVFIVITSTWCIDTLGWILEIDPSYHLEMVHHVEAMALFIIFVCMGDHFRNLRYKFKPVPEEADEEEEEGDTSIDLEEYAANK